MNASNVDSMPMRPGDHPDFFKGAGPDGRTRESTLRLDSSGRFWHDCRIVKHPGLVAALRRWIGRHPDDGRYVLSNGYDWTYFTVDDAPYLVEGVRFEPVRVAADVALEPERILLRLSDGDEEPWQPEATRVGSDGALYTTVKRGTPGGPYEAKFTRHAQTCIAPVLVEEKPDGVAVRFGGRTTPIRG
ncbi:MAG: hypothetical protein ABSF69_04715 [Polyangiaceae bacterium]|jgi:hypothetical protein